MVTAGFKMVGQEFCRDLCFLLTQHRDSLSLNNFCVAVLGCLLCVDVLFQMKKGGKKSLLCQQIKCLKMVCDVFFFYYPAAALQVELHVHSHVRPFMAGRNVFPVQGNV